MNVNYKEIFMEESVELLIIYVRILLYYNYNIHDY